MKNLEFLYKYYPLLVRYRRSIAASLAGLGTLIALSLVIPGPGSQTKVLVATQAITAGRTLTASDFTEKSIPDESAWSTLKSEPSDLVGRVLARSLAPNQPISDNDLVGSGLLTGLPENYVAVSIPVSASTSNSLLSIGNFIDVYGSSNDGLSTGVLIASRARILAIPNQGSGSMFSSGSQTNSIIVGVDSTAAISIAGNASNQGFTIALLP
jgi:Flp pilus assembly protein CpaB